MNILKVAGQKIVKLKSHRTHFLLLVEWYGDGRAYWTQPHEVP
jgi:hypothetical protein